MDKRGAWAAALLALIVAGCGLSSSSGGTGAKVEVVAAENFWGSIAEQLGGDHAHVVSLVSNPAVDPHDYDATPRDAQLLAGARYVIVNGSGYDPWAPKLLAANPVSGRRTLDVGALVGVAPGGNPHLWYSPDYVNRFVDRVTADLKALDPADAPYFEGQAAQYRSTGLREYAATIAAIRAKYAGTPVGASESIFVYTAESTGLVLLTPPGYMQAISEGSDPTAADKATAERQIAGKQVKVFVFNSQNSTPDVEGLVSAARAAGIPVVEITETLVPANATFQDWQTRQLRSLLQALGG